MNKFSLVCCLGLALVGCSKKKEPQPAPPATGSGSAVAPATGSGSAAGSGSAMETGSAAAGSGSAAAGSGSAAAGSAEGSGSAAPAAPDEATLRQGKKTGLGAPDEKVEVVTEDLIRQIAAGKVPAKRFIDPKAGVLDWAVLPGAQEKRQPDVQKQRCGADAEAAVVKYAKAMVANETKGKAGEYGAIFCDNAFATVEDRDFGAGDPESALKDVVPMKHVTCGSGGEMEYAEDYAIEWVPDGSGGLRIAALVSTEHGARTFGTMRALSAALKDAKPCK